MSKSYNRYARSRHRRSIRLKGWDYRSAGAYFVTICTHEMEHVFADPVYLDIAQRAWLAIPTQRHGRFVSLDEWVVMPNHVHGILWLQEAPALPARDRQEPAGVQPNSLGSIVGNFKSVVTRKINGLRETRGAPVWQRGFYDHIMRNEKELNAIRQYIRDNPARWEQDRDNLDDLLGRMDKHE